MTVLVGGFGLGGFDCCFWVVWCALGFGAFR